MTSWEALKHLNSWWGSLIRGFSFIRLTTMVNNERWPLWRQILQSSRGRGTLTLGWLLSHGRAQAQVLHWRSGLHDVKYLFLIDIDTVIGKEADTKPIASLSDSQVSLIFPPEIHVVTWQKSAWCHYAPHPGETDKDTFYIWNGDLIVIYFGMNCNLTRV